VSEQPPPEQSTLLYAAEAAVKGLYDRLTAAENAARRRKWWNVALSILVVIVLILVLAVAGSAGDNSRAIRQAQAANRAVQAQQAATKDAAFKQCLSGNNILSAEVVAWDAFVQLLLKGNTDPKAKAEGAAFEKFVASNFRPRNCYTLYHIKLPAG